MNDTIRSICIIPRGVKIADQLLPANPTVNDLLQVLGPSDRILEKQGGKRRLYVFDDEGVSFLVEVRSGAVYWLMITFEQPKWRDRTESDPTHLFTGVIEIGHTSLRTPIVAQLAELLNTVVIRDISFTFTVHEDSAAKLTISFPLNESMPST